jgi:molybdopterin/thiamine biosynthesis adenylyltransferase
MAISFASSRKSPQVDISMTPPTITVAQAETHEDRFSRFRLIPWWNQEKMQRTRVLVIGAGALGNEILKNLALLGFRKIVIVDMDRIDESNLSRTVLYRKEDVGGFKAVVAARAAQALCPDAIVHPLVANVVHNCGLGLFQWSDLILAGLDNREARLWINRSAWKMNRPWIDGAIEGINGVARVFLPGAPPCYECTLGETDWKLLERRMSCNLLAHEADVEGKVPTTPTISSIIAGIQVQEAVKLIHGLPTLASRGFVFEGLNHTSYPVTYTENADCMSHYTLQPVVDLPRRSSEITLRDILARAQKDLESKDDVVIEFSRDIITKLTCLACHEDERRFAAVGMVRYDDGRCSRCGQIRTVVTAHSYDGSEDFGDLSIDALGLPLYDVFTARAGERETGYLIAGDRPLVLGALSEETAQ